MRVFAAAPFRYPPQTGTDYPYGKQDIANDSLARTLITGGYVVQEGLGGAGAALLAVSISGGTAVGSVLTVTIAPGFVGTPLYQWRRDGVNIPGATASTYTTVAAGTHDCVVTGLAYTSSGLAVVSVPTAPVVTVAPTITGTPTVGVATAYTAGTYTGNPNPTVTRQWQLSSNGGSTWANIVGETNATYTPITSDGGNQLRVVETASNGVGSPAVSASSGVVVSGLLSNPIYAEVGDSLGANGFNFYGIDNSHTLVRQSDGSVVGTRSSNHNFLGVQDVYLANKTDATFEELVRLTVTSPTTYTYQSSVLAAGSATGATGDNSPRMFSPTRNGMTQYINGYAGGGLRYAGCFCQIGDRIDQMGGAVAKAIASPAQVIGIIAGTNDMIGGRSAGAVGTPGTILGDMVTYIVAPIVAAGKKFILYAMPPLAAPTSGQRASNIAAFAGYQAIAASYPGQGYFSDTRTGINDASSDGQALAGMLYDGTHPGRGASRIRADAAWATLQTIGTFTPALPASSSDVPSFSDAYGRTFTRCWSGTNWTGTTNGTLGTGESGQVSGNTSILNNSSVTAVASVVARGGTLGSLQRQVVTPAAANKNTVYFGTTSFATVSLATLGLSAGDEAIFMVEYQAAGALNSNNSTAILQVIDQASGAYVNVTGGDSSAVNGAYSDAGTPGMNIMWCRFIVPASGVTGLTLSLANSFHTITTNTLTFDIGRVEMYRKTAG